jgi:2-polyprenyl-3-methyl-5-hydroxy-6-metoxy-1,4-benzoquinol methylase
LLPPKKNFIQAKFDFIDEMLKFGQFNTLHGSLESPIKVLDVGCGIGGTSRYGDAFGFAVNFVFYLLIIFAESFIPTKLV